MAAKNKPGSTVSASASASASTSDDQSGFEQVLRPFQAASEKYLEATAAAYQDSAKNYVQSWYDFQEEVRKGEQRMSDGVAAATKKYAATVEKLTGNPDETYSARAKAQQDFEQEVKDAYVAIQTELDATARKLFGDDGAGFNKRLSDNRQDVYQSYLGDLRQAWGGVKDLDPNTVSTIATSILQTISAAG